MSRSLAAALQFALIAPAVVFLVAVVARSVGPLGAEPMQAAQSIVVWYSGHVWTLWVLLLALPMGAFLIGGAVLLGPRDASARARRAAAGAVAVAAATVAAGVILAVVILHMLAN